MCVLKGGCQAWGAAGAAVAGTASDVVRGLASQPSALAPSTAASASLSSERSTLTLPL